MAGPWDKPPSDEERAGPWATPPTEAERVRPAISPHVDPLEGVSTAGKFAAGVGEGSGRMYANLMDMLRVPGLVPGSLRGALGDTSALDSTGAGKSGKFLGELLATAPVGMGAGMVARGLVGAGAGLAPLFARAAPLVGAGVDAVTQGAIAGGPENARSGALMGLLTLGALKGGGKLLSPLVNGIRAPLSNGVRRLVDLGMNLGDFTPGTAFPDSALNKIEQLGQHSIFGGKTIQAARQRAAESYEQHALSSAAPGGPMTGKPGSLESLYESFEPAYAPIRSVPVPATIQGVPTRKVLQQAFKIATDDPNVYAPASVRADVNKFLQDQATTLDLAPTFRLGGSSPVAEAVAPGAKQLAEGARIAPGLVPLSEAGLAGEVTNAGGAPTASSATPKKPVEQFFHTAEPMLAVRQAIRKAIRSAETDQEKELFRNAEGLVTNALEKRLTPEAADTLRAVDSQYAKYKILEDAYARAGDKPFSASYLSAAVKAATPRAEYARGGGGLLRDLASAGKDAFDPTIPQTGVSHFVGPRFLHWSAGPIGYLANSPSTRNAFLGATGPQMAAQSVGDLINRTLPNGLTFGLSGLSLLANGQ